MAWPVLDDIFHHSVIPKEQLRTLDVRSGNYHEICSTSHMFNTYVCLALCLSYRKKPMNAILTDYSIATLGLYRGVL